MIRAMSLDDLRGQPHGWFVHQEQFRFCHQRPSDYQHLLFATRHGLRELGPTFAEEGEPGENVFQVVFDRILLLAKERPGPQVFLDREIGKNSPALGNMGDSPRDDPVRAQVVDPFTGKMDLAPVQFRESGNRPQRRGLAGAVASDNGDDTAVWYFERDVADCGNLAVGDGNVPHLKQHGACLRGRPR